jgi:methionine biosynthesis protein MetW
MRLGEELTEEYRLRYDEYWAGKDRLDNFSEYERNECIASFFNAQNVREGTRILDIGGGDGSVSDFFSTMGFDVTLLDVSIISLRKAKVVRGLSNCILGDAQYLPFQDETFDFAFCGDVIEHVYSPHRLLVETHRVLRKGGQLVVSFPNMSYWRHRIDYLLYGMVPKSEGSDNEPWEWEHIRFFNRQVAKKLLEISKFSLEETVGVSKRGIERFMARRFDLLSQILVIKARR